MHYKKAATILFCMAIIAIFEPVSAKGFRSPVLGGDERWELVKNKNEIKVYTRSVPISPIKSFRGVTELDTDLSTMVAFFMDVKSYTKWMKLCKSAEKLAEATDHGWYQHTVNNPPWPVMLRDCIVRTYWSQDLETHVVIFEFYNYPDYIPEIKGHVRAPEIMGYYSLTPQKNGKVELAYEALADPGGWIPTWIVNWGLVATPYSTLLKIRKMMPMDQYKGQRFSFLEDPFQKGTDNGEKR